MGVAVVEGDDVLYYGVKDLRKMRPAFQLTRAPADATTDLIARYEPTKGLSALRAPGAGDPPPRQGLRRPRHP